MSAFYKLKTLPNSVGVYGRCIGNGGFPSSHDAIPARANVSGLMAYDDRLYMLETGFLPIPVTYNGFVHLELDQGKANVIYSSLATDPATGELSPTLQTDLVQELWAIDPATGDVQLQNFDIIDPEMTVITEQ